MDEQERRAGVSRAYGGGGTVTNSGNITGSVAGVVLGGTPAHGTGTVMNSGNISGGLVGTVLTDGGVVTNAVGGNISGPAAGVVLQKGGTVSNAGLILSGVYGVFSSYNSKTAANVTNSGLIIGLHGAGVYLGAGGNVTNSGTIAGNHYGVYIGTSVAGSGPTSGNVTNMAGGLIASQGPATAGAPGAGVYFGRYAHGYVNNAGNIVATNTFAGAGSQGVFLNDGGVVINSGNIAGVGYGVLVSKYGAGTVVNSGTIAATGNTSNYFTVGVELDHGGTVTNSATGVIVGGDGVLTRYSAKAVTNVTNAGLIIGTGPSLSASAGVYLGAGGNVTNSGTIIGGAYGVYIGTSSKGFGQTFGNVTNAAGGLAVATTSGTAGVVVLDGGGVPAHVTDANPIVLVTTTGANAANFSLTGGTGFTNFGGGHVGLAIGPWLYTLENDPNQTVLVSQPGPAAKEAPILVTGAQDVWYATAPWQDRQADLRDSSLLAPGSVGSFTPGVWIKAVGDWTKTGNATRVIVVGHTDTSGGFAYNMRLSERRAKATADALVADGVNQTTLQVDWKGKTDLAVQTPDGVKEPLNRRSTISINF